MLDVIMPGFSIVADVARPRPQSAYGSVVEVAKIGKGILSQSRIPAASSAVPKPMVTIGIVNSS